MNLRVGQVAEITNVVTEEVVGRFTTVTGDLNPVHVDEAYAATTPFGRRIAPGALASAYISAVLGTKLPGHGTIYLSQSVRFLHPVYIGDTVVARVEVTSIRADKPIVTLRTSCVNQAGTLVVDGEAVVKCP
jgi:acyl dehydratase